MIFLAQTDTTAGFLSKNLNELNAIKRRDLDQRCLITTAKFSELKKFTRVPNAFKNFVRRVKKTTIIYPNLQSIRVVKNFNHEKFLLKNGWFYSTSANLHGKNFDEIWAKNVADEIVDKKFWQDKPSKIFKISRSKIKKIL